MRIRSEEEKKLHSAYMREWRSKNRERVRAQQAVYVVKNAERIRELARIRYAKDPSKKFKSNKKHRAKHPEHRVAYERGLSRELVKQMRANGCAICGSHGTERRPLHIDHCHRTGRVRDALCNNCNGAIGFLRDDPRLADSAAAYLRRHST